MRLNDLCAEEIAAWIESPRGKATMMGTSGTLTHPQLDVGHYSVGVQTNLDLPADAAIARHLYGVCVRDRLSGTATVNSLARDLERLRRLVAP